MKTIEIYGDAKSSEVQEIATFLMVRSYPWVMRCTYDDSTALSEYQMRRKADFQDASLPQIFIGPEQIGSLKDLEKLGTIILQQKLSE